MINQRNLVDNFNVGYRNCYDLHNNLCNPKSTKETFNNHNINNNFHISNISSSNFTGLSNDDLLSSYLEPNDPNKYIDYLNKNLIFFFFLLNNFFLFYLFLNKIPDSLKSCKLFFLS